VARLGAGRGAPDLVRAEALFPGELDLVSGREDLAGRPVALLASVVVALALLWRRTHPLAAVAVAFGVLTAVDVMRILASNPSGLLHSVAGTLVLAYSVFRWGAGREAGYGLAIILIWLTVSHVAEQPEAWEVVAGYGFFLFSAALGASIRFHANARTRDIEQAKLRQRNQLARELHDTVGHHVSAIAIQAQADASVIRMPLRPGDDGLFTRKVQVNRLPGRWLIRISRWKRVQKRLMEQADHVILVTEEARRLGCEQLHLDSGVEANRLDAHRLYLNTGMRFTSYHFARPL
jgi:hypothetical protein